MTGGILLIVLCGFFYFQAQMLSADACSGRRYKQEAHMKEWQELLLNGYDSIEQIKDHLTLSNEELTALISLQEQFPVFINKYYFSLIDWSDPGDPIRKMSVPALTELERAGSFDTSGEHSNTVMPGLQHKYKQTVMMLSTNQCAMYCRHCFRKRLVGSAEDEICSKVSDIAAYIRDHEEISNVLISGGDAFMNSNDTIEQYLSELCSIDHLDFIRFGTRVPVVLPQRITSDPGLMEILESYSKKKKIYVITQFNHPKEITKESAAAVDMLLSAGIPVRNQTVLLKGINDDSDVMGLLLKQLTAIGAVPYYIFQCRPVTGVLNQFQIPLKTGAAIVRDAMQMQNGQGKSCRFMLSHETGKIEILGPADDGKMMFKYHQTKYPRDAGRIFSKALSDDECWLDTID